MYFMLKLVMLENCSEINTRKNKYSVVALVLLLQCLRGTSRSWTVIPTAIAGVRVVVLSPVGPTPLQSHLYRCADTVIVRYSQEENEKSVFNNL
jgi:hypothetical protein